MAALPTSIPEKTIERLSEYRRTLLSCKKQGISAERQTVGFLYQGEGIVYLVASFKVFIHNNLS